MISALILFVAAFCIVFALGFQSLNVNRGHYVSAFLTSFVIGGSNLVLLKILPAQTTPLELVAYLAGGPFGIVASMWAHQRWMGKRSNVDVVEAAEDAEYEYQRLKDEIAAEMRSAPRSGSRVKIC